MDPGSSETSTAAESTTGADTSGTADTTADPGSTAGPDTTAETTTGEPPEPEPAEPDIGQPDMGTPEDGGPGPGCDNGVIEPGEFCLPHKISDSFDAPGGPTGLAIADINRDGVLDIAVALQDAGRVAVSFGDPDYRYDHVGTQTVNPKWAEDNAVVVGAGPRDLLVRELVGDAPRTDLFSVNEATGTVSMLMGWHDPDYPLLSPTMYAAHMFGETVDAALADFDGDGHSDLLLGKLSVGFHLAVDFEADGDVVETVATDITRPAVLTTGDLDGDGWLEIIAADPVAQVIQVFAVIDGGGGVELIGALGPVSAGPPRDIAVADFDGDGAHDLVVLHGAWECDDFDDSQDCAPDRLSVYPQLLDEDSGLDDYHLSYLTSSGARDLEIGDFNFDGVPDVVIGYSATIGCGFYLFDATGELVLVKTISHGTPGPIRIAVADLNQDGALDLVASHRASDAVRVRFNRP